jgi:hypothetical protein
LRHPEGVIAQRAIFRRAIQDFRVEWQLVAFKKNNTFWAMFSVNGAKTDDFFSRLAVAAIHMKRDVYSELHW